MQLFSHCCALACLSHPTHFVLKADICDGFQSATCGLVNCEKPNDHMGYFFYGSGSFIAVVLNWRRFCLPGDIWQCLETFLVITGGKRGYWYLVCRDQGSFMCPTRHRAAPTSKNYPAPDISSAEVKKPCFKVCDSFDRWIRVGKDENIYLGQIVVEKMSDLQCLFLFLFHLIT